MAGTSGAVCLYAITGTVNSSYAIALSTVAWRLCADLYMERVSHADVVPLISAKELPDTGI